MTRALTTRRQDQTFAELKELAGERWADVVDQAPTIYAVSDKISRSRRYRIARTRNVLINAHRAIVALSPLPEDLRQINLAIFQELENIENLIALLEAAHEASDGPA